MLTIHVTGTPAPQGSHRAFVVNGRAVVTNDSKKTRPWRQDVKAAALNTIAETSGWQTLTGPVGIRITFRMPRPGYHYGTGKNANRLKPSAPILVEKKPDIDKLTRSSLDALGEAGMWRDDAQVASMQVVKEYATDQPPGADIAVWPMVETIAEPQEQGALL